mmetsp:Transcript_99946/g.214037  ORF Transcript_99946/g.214037 Transcript_99946/m.214037 type:complete len:752 (-) Transcript_99946:113-2368(-)
MPGGDGDRVKLPKPVPDAVLFADPRSAQGEDVGVIGFYYPGKEEAWDTLCGAAFLGNFYDLGPEGLVLEAPCEVGRRRSFTNSEAAFQALKFWPIADEFSTLSGNGAFQRKRQLRGQEDITYGGYGGGWRGMLAVLKAKFGAGTVMAEALLRTGDAFLLEHNAVEGRDKVWSNNHDGEGKNWLGLQLMLIRDRLSGQDAWTRYAGVFLDLETGDAVDQAAAHKWQEIVRGATKALVKKLEASQKLKSEVASAAASAEAPMAVKGASPGLAASEATLSPLATSSVQEKTHTPVSMPEVPVASTPLAPASSTPAVGLPLGPPPAAPAGNGGEEATLTFTDVSPSESRTAGVTSFEEHVPRPAPRQQQQLLVPEYPGDASLSSKGAFAVTAGASDSSGVPAQAWGDKEAAGSGEGSFDSSLPQQLVFSPVPEGAAAASSSSAGPPTAGSWFTPSDKKPGTPSQAPTSEFTPAPSGLSPELWANNPLPPPPDDEEDAHQQRLFPEVQGEEPEWEDLTGPQIHAKILEKESLSPLELAALARVRCWETGAEGYNVQEMMDMTRWLEAKLAPPAPKKSISMWRPLLMLYWRASSKARAKGAALVVFILFSLLTLISAATGLAIELNKQAAVTTSGLLTVPADAGGRQAVGVGSAVHLHGLLDYPSLPMEDLRRAQDVTLTKNGTFHFYRIAGVTQIMGGGIRLLAEDGTVIRVEDGSVRLARPWVGEELAEAVGSGGTWESGGAFRALSWQMPPDTD